MASRKLKRGDVVALKCGGPVMVVVGESGKLHGHVLVNWFTPSATLCAAELHHEVLVLTEDLKQRVIPSGSAPPGVKLRAN